MTTTSNLDLKSFWNAASESFVLLARYPFRWLLLIILFLVSVESLMFIPYVGFVVKMIVSGIVSAQILLLFSFASAGRTPSIKILGGLFHRSFSSQAVIAASALIPFLLGMVYLIEVGDGVSAVAYFFGSILKDAPPDAHAFFGAKCVMYVAALPLAFISPAIVLCGLNGLKAAAIGIRAAFLNWPILLALLAIDIAFERLEVFLPASLPGWTGIALSIVALILFLGWSMSLSYALAARIYGVAPGDSR